MSHDTSLPNEQWRDIPGWEGYYQASNHGRVRSLDRVVQRSTLPQTVPGRVLSPGRKPNGYLYVRLSRPGNKNVLKYVHRAVLEAFVGAPPQHVDACHGDGSRDNNHVNNLRWGTRSENGLDAVRHGRNKSSLKTRCPRGHALVEPNLDKYRLRKGGRICRSCQAAGHRLRRRPYLDMQMESDQVYSKIMKGVDRA